MLSSKLLFVMAFSLIAAVLAHDGKLNVITHLECKRFSFIHFKSLFKFLLKIKVEKRSKNVPAKIIYKKQTEMEQKILKEIKNFLLKYKFLARQRF
jgi:hypothetical protein